MKRINLLWGTTQIEVRIRRGNTSSKRLETDGHQNSYAQFIERRRHILTKY